MTKETKEDHDETFPSVLEWSIVQKAYHVHRLGAACVANLRMCLQGINNGYVPIYASFDRDEIDRMAKRLEVELRTDGEAAVASRRPDETI